MAKQILDDEDEKDTSPESVESLAENDSESDPSDKDVIDNLSTKLDPEMQDISDKLEMSRPDDSIGDMSEQSSPLSETARLQDIVNKVSGKTPIESRMNTGDAIAALLGNKQQQLSSAQNLSNNLQYLANMNRAGETISNAFAPLAHRQADNEGYKAALAQAQVPVENVLQQQGAQTQGLKDISVMNTAKNEMAKEDPTSDVSKLYNQLARESIKKAGLGINLPNNMSASNIEKIMPGIENMANRHEQSMTRQSISEQNALMKQGLQGQAQSQKQTQALTQTQQMLESARGNPEVQQALKDRYAASKANALISQNYDPNNMSPAQVHLLASEVGKIATGGVPSVAEMDALTPQTINSKLAGVSQALTNKPSPANAGAFIKQYQDYLNDLNKNAQNVINDKFGRVIETRKGAIGDENYNTLKDQYLKPPVLQATKSAQQYGDDVLKYASDHNITPSQAQAIKMQRTSGGQ